MTTLQIALGLVLLVLVAWLWMSRRATRPDADEIDRIDTLIGWPPQATRVLTTQERVAFATLVKALPEYMILAQVPLARFVSVPKRNSYVDWLRRLGYQCADFVVCDMAAQVVAVVEVQPSQPTERARKRLARMARTLKAAHIPMQVWSERSLPSASAARDALLPRPVATPSLVPATRAAAAGAAIPALPSSPFDDSHRDSAHDERIELLEPPPSTWFDDLDSEPVPLRKP
ncbi:MAG: DUF2726 domain-containing protein [Burkholderiales bacterium]|nr:DUF2726 domain-containing protein [Burkholderiales bacterium]